jgi:phage/plasmid-like protein (TIGR03299 family)
MDTMAHNLARNADGSASFYSLRQAGWHGLGTVVDAPLSDPRILEVAGLNWTAEKVGLWTETMETVETHRAIRRSDTGAILGVVGEGFQTLQNAEMLDYLRTVGKDHEMTVETAGALGAGETVWCMARIPDMDFIVAGKDVIQSYFLIAQGHAGNRMLNIMPTTVRVVCQNTLRAATSNEKGRMGKANTLSAGYALRHTSGMRAGMDAIARVYQSAMADNARTQEAMRGLASVRSTADSLPAIVAAAWPVKADADETQRAETIRLNRLSEIRAIRRSETCNVEGTAGTLFADFNAVTEWIDHESISDKAKRFVSSQFGGAMDDAKGRAWEAALALV